jgi:hypothetical protein
MPLFLERNMRTLRQDIHNHKTNIMAGICVLEAGVTQPGYYLQN